MKNRTKRNLHKNIVLGITVAMALMTAGCGLDELPQKVTRADQTEIVVMADEDAQELQTLKDEIIEEVPEMEDADGVSEENPEEEDSEEELEENPEEEGSEGELEENPEEDSEGELEENPEEEDSEGELEEDPEEDSEEKLKKSPEEEQSDRHSGSSKKDRPSQPAAPENPSTEEISKLPHEHEYEIQESKAPTCTESGYTTELCKLCGDVKTTTVKATGHTEGGWIIDEDATCEGTGSKHTECTVCGEIIKTEVISETGHTEGSWIIDEDATCEGTGSRHTECTVCGKTITTEEIPAKGHSMGEWTTVKDAECESDGKEERGCNDCSYTEERGIPAAGHKYGDWIIDKEATEEEEGQKHKECEYCGDIIEEDIEQLPAHEHNYSEADRKEATCTEAGYITYECECGDSYDTVINITPHISGDWTVVREATEEKEGLEVRTCTVCGTETDSKVIDRLEHVHDFVHTHKDADCTSDGYDKDTCRKCGAENITIIPATGHEYGAAVIVDPTCTENGSSTITCTVCGNKETTTIDKIAHYYVEVSTVPATCTSEGKVTYQCQTCDEVIKKLTEPKGHSFEWTETKNAELGVDGSKAYKCIDCGYVDRTETIPMITDDGVDQVWWIEAENGQMKMVIGHYDEAASEEMFNTINAYRVENGLKALDRLPSLTEYANIRARETTYLWSHTRPSGKDLGVGENILNAPSGYSVQNGFIAWKNSSGHNANMLGATYNYMDVKCFLLKTKTVTGKTAYAQYWSTLFSGYENDWTLYY